MSFVNRQLRYAGGSGRSLLNRAEVPTVIKKRSAAAHDSLFQHWPRIATCGLLRNDQLRLVVPHAPSLGDRTSLDRLCLCKLVGRDQPAR